MTRASKKCLSAARAWFLVAAETGKIPQEAAGQAGRHMGELDVLALAELEKPPDGPGVGAAGLGVRDPGGEELVGREAGDAAGALQHRREGFRGDVPPDGFGFGESWKRSGHNHLR